jgi:hypothetical protein
MSGPSRLKDGPAGARVPVTGAGGIGAAVANWIDCHRVDTIDESALLREVLLSSLSTASAGAR